MSWKNIFNQILFEPIACSENFIKLRLLTSITSKCFCSISISIFRRFHKPKIYVNIKTLLKALYGAFCYGSVISRQSKGKERTIFYLASRHPLISMVGLIFVILASELSALNTEQLTQVTLQGLIKNMFLTFRGQYLNVLSCISGAITKCNRFYIHFT